MDHNQGMTASIVIPARNEEKNITVCLKAIRQAQLQAKMKQLEILVLDGCSSDRTVNLAQKEGAKVILNPHLSVVAARNLGVRQAKGEIVGFTDADCRVAKDWLKLALKYFRSREIDGLGGPVISAFSRTPFARAVSFWFNLAGPLTGAVQGSWVKKKTQVEDLPGCNAFYRKDRLLEAMPVDETLLTAEDVALNFRLRQQGCHLWRVPEVRVFHYRRETPRRLFRQIYRFARGRVQVGRESLKMIGLSHLAMGLFLPLAVAAGFFLVKSPFFVLALAVFFLSLVFDLFLAFWIIIIAWSLGFWREILWPQK